MDGLQIKHDIHSSFPFWMNTERSKGSQKSAKRLGRLSAFLACTSRLTVYEPSQLSRCEALGSGTTFHAMTYKDIRTGTVVVVKSLRGLRTESADGFNPSVFQELKVSVYPPFLKHRNIARTLGVLISGNALEDALSISLVVEFAELGSLEQYLAMNSRPKPPKGIQSVRQRLHLIKDVCAGLEILHRCRVVHGDIKPDNVLLFPNNSYKGGSLYLAKLSDFGSSIVEDTIYEPVNTESVASMYRGTPLYAPHYVRTYSGRLPFHTMPHVDIYSFGLLLWTTVKGKTYYDPTWDEQNMGAVEYLDAIGIERIHRHFESDLRDLAGSLSETDLIVLSKAFVLCVTDVTIDSSPVAPVDRERLYRDSFSSITRIRQILLQEHGGSR